METKSFYEIRKASAEADHAMKIEHLITDESAIIDGVLNDLAEDEVIQRFEDLSEAREALKKLRCYASAHKGQVVYILDAEIYYIVKIDVDEGEDEEEDFDFAWEFAEFDPKLPNSWATNDNDEEE